MPKILFAVAIALPMLSIAQADDRAKVDPKKPTTATFMITGLHCPGCTTTIESSLAKTPGLESIKVGFDTKMAKVQFDEATLPASRIAQLIAATPHMMGPSMHYDAWLVLKAPDLKDDAAAAKAKDALKKIAVVKSVNAYLKQQLIEIQFATDGKATGAELIDALSAAGIKAENL